MIRAKSPFQKVRCRFSGEPVRSPDKWFDDAGAGYSSLQHILQLKPDTIKLDLSLTRAVDVDPARRALATALIFFARETGMRIVAEGIETEAELQMLKELGVNMGQGYLLGRPGPLEGWPDRASAG